MICACSVFAHRTSIIKVWGTKLHIRNTNCVHHYRKS